MCTCQKENLGKIYLGLKNKSRNTTLQISYANVKACINWGQIQKTLIMGKLIAQNKNKLNVKAFGVYVQVGWGLIQNGLAPFLSSFGH